MTKTVVNARHPASRRAVAPDFRWHNSQVLPQDRQIPTDLPNRASPLTLVFDHVTIIDVERGTRIPQQRVIIQGNRITAAGADMIKPRDVTRETYFIVANEARKIGIPFGGHAQSESPLEASDSGARTIDHSQYQMGANGLDGLCWGQSSSASRATCAPIADRFRQNGTWWIPTLVTYRTEHLGPTSQRLYTQFQEATSHYWNSVGPVAPVLQSTKKANAAPSAPQTGNTPPTTAGYGDIAQGVNIPIRQAQTFRERI